MTCSFPASDRDKTGNYCNADIKYRNQKKKSCKWITLYTHHLMIATISKHLLHIFHVVLCSPGAKLYKKNTGKYRRFIAFVAVSDLIQTQIFFLSVNIISIWLQNDPHLNCYQTSELYRKRWVLTSCCCSRSLSDSLFLPLFLTGSLYCFQPVVCSLPYF